MDRYVIIAVILGLFISFGAGYFFGHKTLQPPQTIGRMDLVHAPAKIDTPPPPRGLPARIEIPSVRENRTVANNATVQVDAGRVQTVPTHCPEFIARMDSVLGRDSIKVEFHHVQPVPYFNLTWNRADLPPEKVYLPSNGLWLKTTLSGYNQSSMQIETGYSHFGAGVQWIKDLKPNYTLSYTHYLFR